MSAQIHGVLPFDKEKRKAIKFSDEALQTIEQIKKRYPEGKQKSAVIPVLHIAQAENNGWLSPEVMDYVAELLNITPIEVFEVASFYSMFNLKPVGKCVLEICRTSSCWLNGANEILQYLENKLGIKEGETTPDGMFTIKTVECLGSCGTAPMMQCGASYHENLTYEKIDQIIEKYRTENKRRNYTDTETYHTK